jgi:GH15 family glucan-1,4-alpha-glucosidase
MNRLVVTFISVAFIVFQSKAQDEKKSYHQLTTSNGLIAAVYNDKSASVETVYPHIFSFYDSGLVVMPVIKDIKLKTDEKPLDATYLQNTHIIKAVYRQFVLYYFASFTEENKILYILAKGKKKDLDKLEFSYQPGEGIVTENDVSSTANGESERYFLFGFTDTLNTSNGLTEALGQLKSGKKSLLAKELAFMRNLIGRCSIPKQVTKAERDLFEQSISVLKMSQVSDKEVLPLSYGQILASLRPGVWAIAWVRDGAYAIQAMSKIGMFREAKKGLEFMLKSRPTDQYIHYVHTDGKDYGIGVPYHISVTRYFGNGREEADYEGNRGPNIEIDDFGLFLLAFSDYVKDSKDEVFYRKWNDIIINKVAKAIMHTTTGANIIQRDSGPWEHHLPGKQFAFTNAVCAKGLMEIAALQKKYGLPFKEIEAGAKRIYDGIFQNYLVERRYFRGNAQEAKNTDYHYYDGGTFELFATGLIKDKSLFLSHMEEFDKILIADNNPEKGYIRFRTPDSYENQEWPIVSLRVALAQKMFGNNAKAKKLIDRVTDIVSHNSNLFPEMFTLKEVAYDGAIPMVGYGAGVYIIALKAFYNSKETRL